MTRLTTKWLTTEHWWYLNNLYLNCHCTCFFPIVIGVHKVIYAPPPCFLCLCFINVFLKYCDPYILCTFRSYFIQNVKESFSGYCFALFHIYYIHIVLCKHHYLLKLPGTKSTVDVCTDVMKMVFWLLVKSIHCPPTVTLSRVSGTVFFDSVLLFWTLNWPAEWILIGIFPSMFYCSSRALVLTLPHPSWDPSLYK